MAAARTATTRLRRLRAQDGSYRLEKEDRECRQHGMICVLRIPTPGCGSAPPKSSRIKHPPLRRRNRARQRNRGQAMRTSYLQYARPHWQRDLINQRKGGVSALLINGLVHSVFLVNGMPVGQR